MSSTESFKLSSNNNNLKNGRLTGLANRMLGLESSTASSNNSSSIVNRPQQEQPNPLSSIKRNLFGCRLDHEQLHADLQQMLVEQRRVKSAQWSFDFENLRPIDGGRVQWRRVRVPVKPSSSVAASSSESSPSQSPKSQEQRDEEKYLFISSNESDEEDEHDEEDDEALAVPEFYKRQRRLKLAEVDKNRLNVLANTNATQAQTSQATQKPTSSNSNPTTVRFDENSKPAKIVSNQIKTVPSSVVPATPIKPKATRSSRKMAHFEQLGKILTFSENRKDTLRSASASSHRQPSVASAFKPSVNSAFSQSARKPPAPTSSSSSSSTVKSSRRTLKITSNNNNNNINNASSNSSTSDDKMRQQTLHDLNVFKQRKKRQQQQQQQQQKEAEKANAENPHYLRSHSTTVSKS